MNDKKLPSLKGTGAYFSRGSTRIGINPLKALTQRTPILTDVSE